MISEITTLPGKYRRFIIPALLYITVIYAAGLSYAFQAEQTITISFYSAEEPVGSILSERFPDVGSYPDINISLDLGDTWKLTSYWGDSAYYLIQAESFSDSIAPYRYRPIAPFLARVISELIGSSLVLAFLLMNVALAVLAGLIFQQYLKRFHGFSETLSILGGLLLVSGVAISRTVGFPMLEPMTMLLIVIAFWAVRSKNVRLFIVASVLAVLTKEIAGYVIFVWIGFWLSKPIYTRQNALIFAATIPAVLAFLIPRAILGESALEVNYGYNLLAGEFPTEYGERLFGFGSLESLFRRIFLSFGFIWIGLWNFRSDPFLKRSALIGIPIVVIATVLLSGRIARILWVLYPIVLPLFLIFLRDQELRSPKVEITD